MKDKFKDIDNINITDERKNEILDNIKTDYKRNRKKKKIICSIIVFLVTVVSGIGVIHADEVNKFIDFIIKRKPQTSAHPGNQASKKPLMI